MANADDHKSSAELQREIEVQRHRVEDTIDQIQEKLSPGQLVDELLAYTKGGGGEFVSSLQRNVTANPLPVALLGVSLVWLMAKPASAKSSHADSDRKWDESINRARGYGDRRDDEDEADYPLATISGSGLQRLGSTPHEDGGTYSEFADDSGRKFRALSDPTGRRAGHFADEAGNRFRGFTDEAGQRVEQFRDEAGNLLDEATGWASHTWEKAREKMHDARDAIASRTEAGRHRMDDAGEAIQHQMESLNRTIVTQFRDQPLVGGALAFALGAALGAALPHTRQEDALMGDASDALKEKAGEKVGEFYEQGKETAAELYETASEKAGELYQQARDGVADAADARSGAQPG